MTQGAINDNFAKFTEALFVAENQARQAVEMRTKVQQELAAREKAKKDVELRNLAIRARMDRTGAPTGVCLLLFAWFAVSLNISSICQGIEAFGLHIPLRPMPNAQCPMPNIMGTCSPAWHRGVMRGCAGVSAADRDSGAVPSSRGVGDELPGPPDGAYSPPPSGYPPPPGGSRAGHESRDDRSDRQRRDEIREDRCASGCRCTPHCIVCGYAYRFFSQPGACVVDSVPDDWQAIQMLQRLQIVSIASIAARARLLADRSRQRMQHGQHAAQCTHALLPSQAEVDTCRRRERERERRLDEKNRHGVKKSKLTRDSDRDISEKIALGQANVRASGEAMYDQRLFNQDTGMASGFATDEAYNTYDKPLFADRGAAGVYRPTRGAEGDDEEDGRQFKPDKVNSC